VEYKVSTNYICAYNTTFWMSASLGFSY
jgi:hypothetical protein